MLVTALPDVPYQLTRLGVVMRRDRDNPWESEGVLNPGSARTADGKVWLLPRLVAPGNVSRIGLGLLSIKDGRPLEVVREDVVLKPEAQWERARNHGGVEDARVTWVASLDLYVMTYVAFGALGPKPALAVSSDLRHWRRLGPVHFEYQPDLGIDLNMFPNKDVVMFSEPVPGPSGHACYTMLHRPMWDLGSLIPDEGVVLPARLEDPRPGIWISYCPVDEVGTDVSRLGHLRDHRLVALPAYDFEALKIGAGAPPIRVPEGWLLIHHGVTGRITHGVTGRITDDQEPQQHVRYCAGAMVLDPLDPSRLLARSSVPMLEPETEDEREGTVPNVVFPTAVEEINGNRFVFYGMADTAIGVAQLDHRRLPRDDGRKVGPLPRSAVAAKASRVT